MGLVVQTISEHKRQNRLANRRRNFGVLVPHKGEPLWLFGQVRIEFFSEVLYLRLVMRWEWVKFINRNMDDFRLIKWRVHKGALKNDGGPTTMTNHSQARWRTYHLKRKKMDQACTHVQRPGPFCEFTHLQLGDKPRRSETFFFEQHVVHW